MSAKKPDRNPERKAAGCRLRQGFTLAELLVTMVLMIMVSAVITNSLAFAFRTFTARTGDTSAQLLCDTISLLVQDEITSAHESTVLSCPAGDAPTDITETKSINGITLPAACFKHGSRDVRTATVQVTDKGSGNYTVLVVVTSEGQFAARNQFDVSRMGDAADIAEDSDLSASYGRRNSDVGYEEGSFDDP